MAVEQSKSQFEQHLLHHQEHVAPNLKQRQLIFDSFHRLKNEIEIASNEKIKKKFIIDDDDDNAQNDVLNNSKGVLLYSWGAGYHGQLGLSNNKVRKKCVMIPQQVDINESVIQVDCGGFHTVCVTSSGTMYTWGDGSNGQLGNLHPKHNMISIPTKVDYFISNKIIITQVAAGQYHTACVSTSGALYTWGSGKYGQHGHGSRLSERYPKQVMNVVADVALEDQKTSSNSNLVSYSSLGKFIQVSCGDRHTAVLMKLKESTKDSMLCQIFTFGNGTHGQLGHQNTKDSNFPKAITLFKTGQQLGQQGQNKAQPPGQGQKETSKTSFE